MQENFKAHLKNRFYLLIVTKFYFVNYSDKLEFKDLKIMYDSNNENLPTIKVISFFAYEPQ